MMAAGNHKRLQEIQKQKLCLILTSFIKRLNCVCIFEYMTEFGIYCIFELVSVLVVLAVVAVSVSTCPQEK